MTPDLIQYTGTYPKVLDIFKIVIDFIWKVISYQIDLGGATISFFGIMVFCFIAVTLLKMFQLQLPSFRGGWDSYGKFSVKRTDIKTGYKKGK